MRRRPRTALDVWSRQLGGAVHRQAADIEQNRSGLRRQRLAACGRVGECQTTRLAQVALLGAHQPILDVLLAPTALAPQPHDPPPQGPQRAQKVGHLCSPKTLLAGSYGRESA